MGGAAGGAAVAGEAATGAVAAGTIALEPLTGGREEQRTRGRKALPPRVFTILKPEKEKNGEGAVETGNGM